VPASRKQTSAAGVAQLCPQCGLCCDSTLFADVELRAGDAPRPLKKAGLTLVKKTRSQRAFTQPCACFNGKHCHIYDARPQQCRRFECGLLKRLAAGTLTASAALQTIAAAKKSAEQIRGLLWNMGQRDERLALTHRYAAAMSAPVDLADERNAERHGELMLAVNDLMQLLHRNFLR